LYLLNRQDGKDLKNKIATISGLLPLVPRLSPQAITPPVVEGPFDRRYVKDERGNWVETTNGEGEPGITDASLDVVADRLRLPTRRTGLRPMLGPPGTQPPPEPKK